MIKVPASQRFAAVLRRVRPSSRPIGRYWYLLAVLCVAAVPVRAQPVGDHSESSWSRFRGPNGSGVSDAAEFPVEFGPEFNVIWATEVPPGRSSPVVVRDRVYVTTTDGGNLVTLSLDRLTGVVVWRRALEPLRDDEFYQGNDASTPTPASDGTNVYVFFSEMGLVSYDPDGNERWRYELGPFENFYGLAASPVVAGDLVLLVCDQARGSFLVAVDTASGERRWQTPRPGRIESWATPVLYSAERSTSVITFGSGWVDGYDVETGEHLWELPGVGEAPVASPTVSGSMLVINVPNHSSEYPYPATDELFAEVDGNRDGRLSVSELSGIPGLGEHFGWADRDGDGDVTPAEWASVIEITSSPNYGAVGIALPQAGVRDSAEIIWSSQQSTPYIASPLIYDDIVYLVRDGGIVQSVDLATGEVFKRGRTSRSAGPVFASPVAADGKIVISSVQGEVAVLRAGVDWEVLAVNELDEPIFASPALVGDRIYVRTPSRLYSFGRDKR